MWVLRTNLRGFIYKVFLIEVVRCPFDGNPEIYSKKYIQIDSIFFV